jgi:hypothetical protein
MASTHRAKSFSVVALALALSFWSFDMGLAQSTPQTIQGPTYSPAAIRRLEIAGIHLGMSPQDVADAMNARGFRLRNPSGVEGSAFYESDDQRVWITLSYSDRRGKPALKSFSYDVRNYSAEEASALADRRAELLMLLGEPTQWTKRSNERQEIGDRFVYTSRRQVIEHLNQAASCYANWECVSMLQGADCRLLIRQVRAPAIEGGFGYRSLHLTVTDYAERARELLDDDRFRRRDLSQAICAIPSIH